MYKGARRGCRACKKTSKGCMHCWDKSQLLGIRRDTENTAAFVLSMVRLLKGSWYSGCERVLELWGPRSLYFPVQGREHAITQSANHWLTAGTHRNLHEPLKEYTCTQGITYLLHKLCIKSLPKCRADLTSQQYILICMSGLPYGLTVFYIQCRESIPKNTLLPEKFLAQTEMMHEYHHIVLYFKKSNRTVLCYTVLKILINKH